LITFLDVHYFISKGAAIIHMILNNLDPEVAQFPQELVTYGGNGQVYSNWAQVITFHQTNQSSLALLF